MKLGNYGQTSFYDLCDKHGWNKDWADTLAKLIELNNGAIDGVKIRSNFSIGYGQACEFAEELVSGGFARQPLEGEASKQLPKDERKGGW